MDKKKTWGQFRFSVIGSLFAKPPDKGDLREQLEELASKTYLHPVKEIEVRFAMSTLERWYYRALGADDPVAALERKVRSDLGNTAVISPLMSEELRRQHALYPHWSYRLHKDNLEALIELKPDLGTASSYASVFRHMKKRGWIKKRSPPRNPTPGQTQAIQRLERREVRSFEAEYVHALWHLDYHQAHRGVVDNQGRWHKPHALCILDDRSRLCCHVQWYLCARPPRRCTTV